MTKRKKGRRGKERKANKCENEKDIERWGENEGKIIREENNYWLLRDEKEEEKRKERIDLGRKGLEEEVMKGKVK